MLSADEKRNQRVYRPCGAALEIWTAHDRQVLAEGSAGTGKSRAILEKHFYCAGAYPGFRALWVRKTRTRLTDSALTTFEDHVVPLGHPCLKGATKENRHSYKFPNGSEIVLCGFDQKDEVDKVMSTEWDAIYVQEAVELIDSEVWDKLNMRLRNGRGPYHQLIGDTNPGHPQHWLNKRCNEGKIKRIVTRHEDNPRYFDPDTKQWTAEGLEYRNALDGLPGHLRKRYFLGLWAAAEGARFDTFDDSVHVFRFAEKFPQGLPDWARIGIGIDWGRRDPYCSLWGVFLQDGKGKTDVFILREDYEAGLTTQGQAARVKRETKSNERIAFVSCDPSMWAQQVNNETGEKLPRQIEAFMRELGADARFGGIKKGYNKSRQVALGTIDSLLERGNGFGDLYIEEGCTNLIGELAGALWDTSPMQREDIDAGCPDHAITALYYLTHNYLRGGTEPEPSEITLPSPEVIKAERNKEIYDRDIKRLRTIGV